METNKQKEIKWWMEEYGFFGKFYMEGDDSKDGYLECRQQTLDERTKMEAEGVIRLLELTGKEKVLDCPCGYGRHSNFLCRKGIEVVGYDINSIHLNFAKRFAIENNLPTKFLQKNMLDINDINKFDAIINMFYSFGFFDTDEENQKVLQNFYNALKPNGKFLMHTDVNLARIKSEKYKFEESRSLNSGKRLRIVDSYNSNTKRIDGKWIISDVNGGNKEVDYSVRVYSKEEFCNMCLQAGFTKVQVFSDWDGKEYSEDAEDMIVIAEK